MSAKPVHRKCKMNLTEARYAEILERKRLAGEIKRYEFEKIKFNLADKTTYTPDFYVVFPGHIEFHEVKGFLREDANVKFKIAAEMFPEFRWVMVRWRNKKTGWEIVKEI